MKIQANASITEGASHLLTLKTSNTPEAVVVAEKEKVQTMFDRANSVLTFEAGFAVKSALCVLDILGSKTINQNAIVSRDDRVAKIDFAGFTDRLCERSEANHKWIATQTSFARKDDNYSARHTALDAVSPKATVEARGLRNKSAMTRIQSGMSNIFRDVDFSAIWEDLVEKFKNLPTKLTNTLKIAGLATLLSISGSALQAQTFEFSDTNFTVVNHSNGGYLYEYQQGPNLYHQYRLTRLMGQNISGSAITGAGAVFMHHNTPLDMSVPFAFSAKVQFWKSTCKASPGNQGACTTSVTDTFSRGITFTLHNHEPYIGMHGRYLGYGWVDSDDPNIVQLLRGWNSVHNPNSFAVAVIPDEGNQRLSFLSGGDITPLQSAPIPIAFNTWHCLDIIWRHSNSGGFIMEVYWNGDWQMSRPVSSYQSLGLTNQNATWGVTAGMGHFGGLRNTYQQCYQTEQKIQFVGMKSGESLAPTKKVYLLGEGFADTLRYTSFVHIACRGTFNIITPDTITNSKIICVPDHHRLEFVNTDLSGAKFFVQKKDGSWGEETKANPFPLTTYMKNTTYIQNDGNSDYILVRVEFPSSGQTLIFKLKMREKVLLNYFSDTNNYENVPMLVKDGEGFMVLDTTMLSQTIPLHPGCNYTVTAFDTNNFQPGKHPRVEVINGLPILKFELNPNVCNQNFSLWRTCDDDCPPESFTFKLYGFNPDLTTHSTCDGFEINFSNCDGINIPNGLIKFELVNTETGDTLTSDKHKGSITVTDAVEHRYRFINPITGKPLKLPQKLNGKLTIAEEDLGLPFNLIFHNIEKEYIPHPHSSTFDCKFKIELKTRMKEEGGGLKLPAGYTIKVKLNGENKLLTWNNPNLRWEAEFIVACDEDNTDFNFVVDIFHAENDLYSDTTKEMSVCSKTIILNCGCNDHCDILEAKLVGIKNIQSMEVGPDGKCRFEFEIPPGSMLPVFNLTPIPSDYIHHSNNRISFTMTCGSGGGLGPTPHDPYMGRYSVQILEMHILTSSHPWLPFQICTLKKAFICGCPGRKPDIGMSLSSMEGGIIGVSYEILNDYVPQNQISFKLYDFNGFPLSTLHTVSLPILPTGNFSFNLSQYPMNFYLITAEESGEVIGFSRFMFDGQNIIGISGGNEEEE